MARPSFSIWIQLFSEALNDLEAYAMGLSFPVGKWWSMTAPMPCWLASLFVTFTGRLGLQCTNTCEKERDVALPCWKFYFIIHLRPAYVPCVDILNFYCTAIRPVLEYCMPLFHHALPQYLSEDIERVQKRVLSIVNPHVVLRLLS